MLVLLLVLFLDVSGAPPASALQPPDSAELCGSCHRSIHEAWKTSAHARAMESRLFQDALELAEAELGAQARRTCLGCHAPVAGRIGDLALQRKVSWEGVTCDFCHSMRGVSITGANHTARIEFGPVKSGTLKDADSLAHGTEYSALHTSSVACAPCHEYKNPLGFPVLTTYSEWKDSMAAAEGQQCQSCHMYRVAGDVVDPRLNRAREARVNLHEMPGSRSLAQLTRTIGANLSTVREGGQLRVSVEIANRTAGHHVPTGSPLRRLVLDLAVDSYDGQRFREERTYERKLADQQGRPVEREHVAMLRSAKVISDTRLAEGEKRIETFSFPVPAGVQAQVKATLWYHYSPMGRTEAQQRMRFLTLQRLVR